MRLYWWTMITLLSCAGPEPTINVTTRTSVEPKAKPTDIKKKFSSVFPIDKSDWDDISVEKIKDLYSASYYPEWSGSIFLHLKPGHYVLADKTKASNDRKKRAFHLSAYDRESRIPLLVYTPGDPSPGPSDRLATLQEVGSTMFSVLNMDAPEGVTAKPLDVYKPKQPKVMVLMVYDALSWAHWDRYLSKQPVHAKFRAESREWTHTYLGHMSSSTTVSHAVMATGQPPKFTGIPINHTRTGMGTFDEVFIDDRPERLLVPTVADLYDAKHDNRPIIASFCSQSRAAIAMAGQGRKYPGGDADIVLWQSGHHGELTTNTDYYQMPDYLRTIGPAQLLAELPNEFFRGLPVRNQRQLFRSPHTIKIGERIIDALLEKEPFGEDDLTDLLLINQKVLDNIAHRMTADTDHFRDGMDALDSFMGRLLETLSQKFGDDYMIILTSDHGFGPGLPSPKKQSDERRHDLSTVLSEINGRLGEEGLVQDIQYLNVYLDEERLKKSGKTLSEICTAFSSSFSWIAHCLTTEDLSLGPDREADDRGTPSSAE